MATNRIETLDPALIRPGKYISFCLDTENITAMHKGQTRTYLAQGNEVGPHISHVTLLNLVHEHFIA